MMIQMEKIADRTYSVIIMTEPLKDTLITYCQKTKCKKRTVVLYRSRKNGRDRHW